MNAQNTLGNKLYGLRKKANLSQEEFAEKLNISRQAVSKWECGESLPDTENLIKISKLYGVSLDELIDNNAKEQKGSICSPSSTEEVPLQEKTCHEENEAEENEEDEVDIFAGKKTSVKLLLALPYPILITIAYLLWGFLANGWALGWTLYLTVPIYYSVLECIQSKRASHFAYPLLMTFIYVFVGIKWGLWHPNWIVFITIPIYYAIISLIEKR